jgi:hypothetical protein
VGVGDGTVLIRAAGWGAAADSAAGTAGGGAALLTVRSAAAAAVAAGRYASVGKPAAPVWLCLLLLFLLLSMYTAPTAFRSLLFQMLASR